MSFNWIVLEGILVKIEVLKLLYNLIVIIVRYFYYNFGVVVVCNILINFFFIILFILLWCLFLKCDRIL